MVERGEVITVSRQIGGMMEAGVDILRITRVLRAQTDNPRLLQVYNELDHDLTMGRSLAEAMVNAPDVWSPFDVSLVQQGESRNDIAGAFNKIADFLQKDEEQEAAQHHAEMAAAERAAVDRVVVEAPAVSPSVGAPMAVIALDGLIDRLQTMGLRFLTVISGLLLALASVWLSVEQGWLEYRWINVTLCSVAALFIGGMGVWVQRRINSDRRREARCSFCGTYSPSGEGLERAPRFAGAAICARCAAIVAKRHEHDLDPQSGAAAESKPQQAANPASPAPAASGNISSGAGSKTGGETAAAPAGQAASGRANATAGNGAARSSAPQKTWPSRSGVTVPPDGEEYYE